MPRDPENRLGELLARARDAALVDALLALLQWDERTTLPIGGRAYRAEQVARVAGQLHAIRTDPGLGDCLGELAESPLAADPHSDEGATIRVMRRDFERNAKIPARLVEELARETVLGQQAWAEARNRNEYALFRPRLDRILALKREQADTLGHGGARYDAMLEEYEPGATVRELTGVLEGLRLALIPWVAEAADACRGREARLLGRFYSRSDQEAFGVEAAARIGFDFSRGRLDVTDHPFCTTLGPHDCRITTRYDERFFPTAFFGILHEAGHGIYEQGLRTDWYGTPPGSFASLGVHESQSRLWENLVGRSRPFWEHHFPIAQRRFPSALEGARLDAFLGEINMVRPSLIRVEADEATYNLHIVLRFELEQALLDDTLSTTDLPAAWNAKYAEFLGITPPDDASGVLQDVHWSAGLFGYFPTYTIGNLLAAQIAEAYRASDRASDAEWSRGDYTGLLEWLRREIHTRGRCFSAPELCRRATGRELAPDALLAHLRGKFAQAYHGHVGS